MVTRWSFTRPPLRVRLPRPAPTVTHDGVQATVTAELLRWVITAPPTT